MRSSILRPTGWLFYRACVALRQILKAWKKPAVRRVRKAALIALLCVIATRQRTCLGDDNRASVSSSSSQYESSQIDSDGIRPIHQLTASISPPAGELPTDLAAQRFAQTPETNVAAIARRGWAPYVCFWQAPVLCYPPLCFAPLCDAARFANRFAAAPATCAKDERL